MRHEYTWKMTTEFYSDRSLTTNKPLTPDTLIVDLFDGERYVVFMLFEARPNMDRLTPAMPSTVALTSRVGILSEEELIKLRKRANYTPDATSQPRDEVVFFPA